MQKQDWLYELPQWNAILTNEKKKQVNTVSRNSPDRSAKERKSEEMIHVHAEVVKNIKCAVEEMHSSISYERELG